MWHLWRFGRRAAALRLPARTRHAASRCRPKINPNGGRDHWPAVGCALLAGGGMRTGQVIGSTNRYAEHAKDRPVHFQEVFATLYHNLGIDVRTATVTDLTGRPQYFVDSLQVEGIENLTASLDSGVGIPTSNASVTTAGSAAITVNDDDSATVSISAGTTATEGGRNGSIQATLNTYANGSASQGRARPSPWPR